MAFFQGDAPGTILSCFHRGGTLARPLLVARYRPVNVAVQNGCGLAGRNWEIYTAAVPCRFSYDHFLQAFR